MSEKTKNKTIIFRVIEYLKQRRWLAIVAFVIIGSALLWGVLFGFSVRSWKPFAWAMPEKENAPSILNTATDSPATTPSQTVEPTSNLVPRRIDGVLVSPEDANPYPVAIMIDNIPPAWPQSGLEGASVLYETLVEGGATRIMAVFAGGRSDKIGPVRSARPCYLEWVSEYDAMYGHVGGSPEALAAISGLGIKDFSQFRNGQYYWRSTDRYAPHNVYTSFELIDRARRDLKYDSQPATYQAWKFKDEQPLAQRPLKMETIEIHFSSGQTWTSRYVYDVEKNVYAKFQAAAQPHLDAETGNQLMAKNVVIVVVPKISSYGEKGRVTLDISGQGRAFVFRDGVEIVGTWQKKDRLSRTLFYDAQGNEIELNRGTTWVSVVPEDREILYTESSL